MHRLLTGLGAAALLGFAGTAASAGMMSHTYEITVTNTSDSELIAPVLVAATEHDADIFAGDYVTKEAEAQVLTGDPAMLAGRIGDAATVAHGTDGDNGALIGPGNSLTFEVSTEAEEIRLFAMVAPTVTPDNYLTATIDLSAFDSDMAKSDDAMESDMMMGEDGAYTLKLSRYDIGHDEKSMERMMTEAAFGAVSIRRLP